MRNKNIYSYETNLINNGLSLVIGCDEVGRGCLAGPVVAAALLFCPGVLQKESWHREIRDSKLLSSRKREELAQRLCESSSTWGIGVVSASVIDRINIHNASLLAMERAVKSLMKKQAKDVSGVKLLVDGRFVVPNVPFSQEAIIGGDRVVWSISAASIIAKVYRDRLMMKLHQQFPAYGYDAHKGYATVAHREALKKHGISAVHRRSFCGNIFE